MSNVKDDVRDGILEAVFTVAASVAIIVGLTFSIVTLLQHY